MMNDKAVPHDFDPTASIRRHKKQRTWQVLLPIILVVLIGVAAIVLMILGNLGESGLKRLADIAVVLFALLLGLMGILLLVILVMLISLISSLRKQVPGTAEGILLQSLRINHGLHAAADSAAEPVIKVKETSAVIKSFSQSLFRKTK